MYVQYLLQDIYIYIHMLYNIDIKLYNTILYIYANMILYYSIIYYVLLYLKIYYVILYLKIYYSILYFTIYIYIIHMLHNIDIKLYNTILLYICEYDIILQYYIL